MSEPSFSENWLKQHVWPRFSRALARKEIYLANHSLGRPPDRVADDVRAALDTWYRDMDGAWDAWLSAREEFRKLTARLVNAPSADCIVPKTSAGQGLRAVLNALPGKPRVLTTDAEFDSLDFILRVYRQQDRIHLKTLPFEEFSVHASDLVVLSTVAFRSSKIFRELKETIRQAHAGRALVLLDVYHHAGIIPLHLEELDADFAVGGSYKYLRGGPGACWLYVHPRHHKLVTLDTGWFAKKDVFAYERPEPPQFGPGGDAWLESTPPVLAPVQALAGLELTLELGVERIRQHNLHQKRVFSSLLENKGIRTEGAGEDYGAFLTAIHADAARIAVALKSEGVNADARGDALRLCPDYLNSEAELASAAAVLEKQLLHPA
jgi:kynureninase